MGVDLRLIFLIMLGVTAILFFLRRGPVMSLSEAWQILLDFLLVPAVVVTVVSFSLILSHTDPLQLILKSTSKLPYNVSFIDAIPEYLEKSLAVRSVSRVDTDGDGFKEWVVFYAFDLQGVDDPLKGAIYDSDRGNPPVIFPYQLRVPERDYLSDGAVDLDFATIPINSPRTVQELLVKGENELSVFRFQADTNTELWQPPKDDPPRYQSIGFFRGNGGVTFDATTNYVNVVDRLDERSQLATHFVYGYQTGSDSYFENTGTKELADPLVESIDFYKNPPTDILNTEYPEKIVLAFYASTCDAIDSTLCRHTDMAWDRDDFTVEVKCNQENSSSNETSAYCAQNDPGYFDLPSLSGNRNLQVKWLQHSSRSEKESLVSTSTGPVAQTSCVSIIFTIGDNLLRRRAYAMSNINGQWKINKRIPITECGISTEQAASGASFDPPAASDSTTLPPLGPPSQ